jgi:hypothetical protein
VRQVRRAERGRHIATPGCHEVRELRLSGPQKATPRRVPTSFYLSLLGFLALVHVIDAVLKSFSNLFRSQRYSPLEKLYSVLSLHNRT